MNNNGIDGYRDFLKRRDGEADLLNRRLANREDFFNSLETNPVRSAPPSRPTDLPAEPAPSATRAGLGQEDAVSVGHRQAQSGRTIRGRPRGNLRPQQ